LATSVVLYREVDGKEVSIGTYGGRGEVTGGSFPVQVWTDYMQQALEGEKVEQFPARGALPDKPQPENTSEAAAAETRVPTCSGGGSGSDKGGDGGSGSCDGSGGSEESADADKKKDENSDSGSTDDNGKVGEKAQDGRGQRFFER